jgi:hypothetical protein
MEENKFYVYVLLDPRKPGKYIFENIEFEYEPFYIGKGHGYRNVTSSKETNKQTKKGNKIKAIDKAGYLPVIHKLNENLEECKSLELEKYYVNLIGRSDLGLGPLANHTDGGEGTTGHKHTEEYKQKRSKSIKQYTLEGVLIDEYKSIKNASKITGIKAQNIGAAISGKYTSAGGYLWCKNKDEIVIPDADKLYHRVVLQYDLEGNFLQEWESATVAKKATGATHITCCCRGKIRNSGGFVWRYKELEMGQTGYLEFAINDMNHDGNFKKTEHSKESLEKMKLVKARSVIQYNLNNEKISDFFSISEAYRATGINKASIVMVCKGQRKTAGGFIWKYST